MGHRELFTRSKQYAWRLPENRTQYLDTGVLRRRSRELPSSPLRHVAYTSALALIELTAGARQSEDQFARRRAAIEGVFRAELPVDWQFPDAKIACAFPRLREKYDMFETRCGSLEALVALLRKCNSAEEFSRRAEALSLPAPLHYFEEFDATYGRDTSADPLWPRQYRQLFHAGAVPTQFLGLSSTASYADFMRAFQASAFNEIVIREALPKSSQSSPGTPTGATLRSSGRHMTARLIRT